MARMALEHALPGGWVDLQPAPLRRTAGAARAVPPGDRRAMVLDGHRPAIRVSGLYGAQQGHADAWQVCLAHQLRDCAYAIEAGDAVFAPRMRALLLRAVLLARRHRGLAEATRREYRRRLERDLDRVMALLPTQRDGKRLRRRCAKLREHLPTFLEHPEISADNNGSERDLRPTATYRKVTGRKVTGGFRSEWGADLFAAVRSCVGTAQRRGIDAYNRHPGRTTRPAYACTS
jgi:transposase